MEYGIIFWGTSIASNKVFPQQKRIITIMTGLSSRTLCKPLFQGLELLNLASQYLLSLMRFVTEFGTLYVYFYNFWF